LNLCSVARRNFHAPSKPPVPPNPGIVNQPTV
jgi:hypothetical protein